MKKKNDIDWGAGYKGYVPATGSTMKSFAKFQKDMLELDGGKPVKPGELKKSPPIKRKRRLPAKRKDNYQRA